MSEPVPAGTFLKPISAALARVLGEAASSAYAPPEFYVVARYEQAVETTRPFDVQPPVETYLEAQKLVGELEAKGSDVKYGLFGPFLNPHPPEQGNQATVAQLKVTARRGQEPEKTFTIEGHKYDALFYSIQAVEKFVIPYYVQHYGAEFGLHVLNSFREAELALMGHLPWSEEVQCAPVLVLFESDGNGAVEPRVLQPPEG